jgi:hypothetical protein
MKSTTMNLVLGLAVVAVAVTGCNVSDLVSAGGDPVRALASLSLNSGGADAASLSEPIFKTVIDDTGIGVPPGDSGPVKPGDRPRFCTATSRSRCE